MSDFAAQNTQTDTRRDAALSLSLADTDNVDDMYLTFALATEEYGVGIGGVSEIVGMQRIMPIPDMPPYIRGVINLRGKVIPLMDVRLRFGMAERAYDERTVIIVMEVDDAPIGLIVDAVREVLEIPPGQVDRPNQFARAAGRSVIAGIGRIADRVAALLDTTTLVSDVDLTAAQELAVA